MNLHPALRRHVLNPLFWWRVFQARDSWQACERCGFVNECIPYGQVVRDNYEAIERDLGTPQPESIRGPEDKRVCWHCCAEMRESYGDHPNLPPPRMAPL